MKKVLFAFLSIAFLCVMVADANACFKHGNSKWALHFAGEHNAKINTCDFHVTNCATEVVVDGPCGPGRYDVYVLALDTKGIAGTRYGLRCDPEHCFYFYGWTSCSDLELPSAGWPGCNAGNAQTWGVAQPIGHVTLGILDVYVYGPPGDPECCPCCLCMDDDPRVGFAEWCDDTSPEPWCCKLSRDMVLMCKALDGTEYPCGPYPAAFGCVCFGAPGYNPCDRIATEKSSWGAVKAIYQ